MESLNTVQRVRGREFQLVGAEKKRGQHKKTKQRDQGGKATGAQTGMPGQDDEDDSSVSPSIDHVANGSQWSSQRSVLVCFSQLENNTSSMAMSPS